MPVSQVVENLFPAHESRASAGDWCEEPGPLRQIDFFSGLPPEDHELFVQRAHRRHYKKHTLLFQQGDETTSIYVIEAGWVRTFATSSAGKEITIGLWSCGDIIGAPDVCATTRSLSRRSRG